MSADTCEKLNKRDFTLLGRVFEAEIANLLPVQIGKSKAVVALQGKGYIEPMTIKLGGRLAVTVSGWKLTDVGQYVYRQNCIDDDNDDGDSA